MKKSRMIASILALVIALVSLTSCGIFKPTAVSVTKKTVENLKDTKSFTSELAVDYSGTVSLSGMNMDITVDADFDMETVVDPAVSHLKGTVGLTLPVFGELNVPAESYQHMENGIPVAYTNLYETGWIRSEAKEAPSGLGNEGSQMGIAMGILQKILSGEIKAELAEEPEFLDGREAYKMDVVIDGDLLTQLLEMAKASGAEDAAVEGETSEEGSIDLSGADARITLLIFKDTMLPGMVTIDCTTIGNVLMEKALNESHFSGTTNSCVISLKIKEYNTIDELKIPDEVTSSASESDGSSIFDEVTGL